jgi:hypothetical protein
MMNRYLFGNCFTRDFGEFLKIFEGNEDFSEILTFWRIFEVFEEYDDR